MRHSKRTVLTADDVDSALSLRNVEVGEIQLIFVVVLRKDAIFGEFSNGLNCRGNIELMNDIILLIFQPIYGFASGDPLRFKKAVGHKDLFYLDDKEVDFKDVRIHC